jgi:hypothetical protein
MGGGDEEEEGDEVRATDLVDADGFMRVNAQRCGTCIYWDENRMYLEEGRREQMEAEADRDESFITCHQTLPYGCYDAPPAVCHGYYQHAKERNWRMRLATLLKAVVRVAPPSTTWNP